jgi:short-subunit dehydrogenase
MNIVVTGASKGIGKSVAESFAQKFRGCHLILCARHMSGTMPWQQELTKNLGCRVTSFDADLSKREGIEAFADQVMQACDVVDVLVNNAGFFEPGSVHDEPEGTLERMLDINLLSAYHLTRRIIPGMKVRRSGHVFNICSVAALQAYPNGGAYSISKWALLGFSKNLREEMKPHGVKVTAVHPGATLTASWDGFDIDPARIMESEDVAAMIVTSAGLSPQACVEDILLRPQLGDL